MQRDKFPRTGKRGVPQQFPRRLYNMLEHETTEAETNGKEPILAWSKTGKAFGISDVAMFANQVLPKHFKTSKFSSFQRNLNLYGFSKVRRGPDVDMYSHPCFIRGQPDLLGELTKSKKGSKSKGFHPEKNNVMYAVAADQSLKSANWQHPPAASNIKQDLAAGIRAVSPSHYYAHAQNTAQNTAQTLLESRNRSISALSLSEMNPYSMQPHQLGQSTNDGGFQPLPMNLALDSALQAAKMHPNAAAFFHQSVVMPNAILKNAEQAVKNQGEVHSQETGHAPKNLDLLSYAVSCLGDNQN